jgi:hypothetical protein
MSSSVVIGLSAVVLAVTDGEAVVLTVRPTGSLDAASGSVSPPGLPFGPFDPQASRTFELALRAFVAQQTGFKLGYVEQLYTFGDEGRDAPRAEIGAGQARVVSVGYLALTARPGAAAAPDTAWSPWTRFFPWEDWRDGRPAVLDAVIAPALAAWAGVDEARRARVQRLFALHGSPWLEERVLERYELLYEAGLAPEAERDRNRAASLPSFEPEGGGALGEPMISDHRRILATGLERLRGKLKYRPIAFELTPPEFTLSTLQRTVEAIIGAPLHKQNFRRALAAAELVEGLGRMEASTGGRPAELYRFRRELVAAGATPGLSLPVIRD